MTDRYFAAFLENFRCDFNGSECTQQHLDAFQGVLPESLLSYWQEFGFSSFGDGLAWIPDPIEWHATTSALTSGVAHPDLGENGTYVPFVRTSFGEVHFWTPGFGRSLMITPMDNTAICVRAARAKSTDVGIRLFFALSRKERFDLKPIASSEGTAGVFEECYRRAGKLARNEMYAFNPPLVANRMADATSAMRVDIHHHLDWHIKSAGGWRLYD